MDNEKARSDCLLSCFLDVLGDKWSLLILRDLVVHDKKHFKDFLESDEKIATNILSDRLKKLEERGFTIKSQDPNKKSQFIYTPTSKAQDLLPVFKSLETWSAKHI